MVSILTFSARKSSKTSKLSSIDPRIAPWSTRLTSFIDSYSQPVLRGEPSRVSVLSGLGLTMISELLVIRANTSTEENPYAY
jgi:hypothetical protein